MLTVVFLYLWGFFRLLPGVAEPLGDLTAGDVRFELGLSVLAEFPGFLRALHGFEALLPRLQRQPRRSPQRILGQAAGEALLPGEQAVLHR